MIGEANRAILAACGLRCAGIKVSTDTGRACVTVQPINGGRSVTGHAHKEGQCGMDDFHPLLEQALTDAINRIEQLKGEKGNS